jgi:NADPH-dependent 2,4-dienoyl-CoA reductase/sulfur reductase-like enzyme
MQPGRVLSHSAEEVLSVPTRTAEIAVVGAGAAGLTAAIEAAQAGAQVTVVDENRSPGGQLFKQLHKFFGSQTHRAGVRGFSIGEQLLSESEDCGVEVLLDTVCWGIFEGNNLALEYNGRSQLLHYQKLILATGASENALAFPGWTLPGVMGAGAAQTLVNIHRVLPGRRVLMVGAGNVGLIVAYQLLQAGAGVIAVVEGLPRIGGYGVHASKIRRAGVPILTSHTILRADGVDCVSSATIARVDKDWQPIPGTEQALEMDTICLAVGLSPMSELAWMAGCRFVYVPSLGGHIPLHNEDMETTVPGIYVAGDIAGIEEASTAMEEGRLAGLAAAGALGHVSEEIRQRKADAWRALTQLRGGPFGEGRRQAKAKIVEAYRESQKSKANENTL